MTAAARSPSSAGTCFHTGVGAAAGSSGVDVEMAFLAVAYGASCAFILPFAHQCNLMIMGPGGYQTRDFVKVGTGLSIVMAATAIIFLAR